MLRNKLPLAVLLLLSAGLLTACKKDSADQTIISQELVIPEQVNYTTAVVEKSDFIDTYDEFPKVEYLRQANLFWENSNARYKECLVARGDSVKKGDPLITFDIEYNASDLENLRLSLTRTEESYAVKCLEWEEEIEEAVEDAKYLYGRQLTIANLNLEKLQLSYEQFIYETERNIEQIRENITEMEELVLNNVLTAPFDGTISNITYHKEGGSVIPGQVLISMYSSEEYVLTVPYEKNTLRHNMELEVALGNGTTYTATVVTDPALLPGSLYQDHIRLRVNEEVVPESFTSNTTVSCDTRIIRDILTISNKAIQYDSAGDPFVYILEDNAMKKRYITCGYSNDEVTWVLTGLSEGQTIILN